MKIKEVTDEYLLFDDGNIITYYHCPDCCEDNYAAFEEIDDIAWDYTFEKPLVFEKVEDCGFRFGNPGKMVFIPCYSKQNGYYSYVVDIYYSGGIGLDNVECEIIY